MYIPHNIKLQNVWRSSRRPEWEKDSDRKTTCAVKCKNGADMLWEGEKSLSHTWTPGKYLQEAAYLALCLQLPVKNDALLLFGGDETKRELCWRLKVAEINFKNIQMKRIVGKPHVLPLVAGNFSFWTPVERLQLCLKHLKGNVLVPCVTSQSANFMWCF